MLILQEIDTIIARARAQETRSVLLTYRTDRDLPHPPKFDENINHGIGEIENNAIWEKMVQILSNMPSEKDVSGDILYDAIYAVRILEIYGDGSIKLTSNQPFGGDPIKTYSFYPSVNQTKNFLSVAGEILPLLTGSGQFANEEFVMRYRNMIANL